MANDNKSMQALKDAFSPEGFKAGKLNTLISSTGALVGTLLDHGMESKAGDAIQQLGNVAAAIPGPWGAIAGGALNLIGGAVSGIFGHQLNEGAVKQADAAINNANNLKFTASNTSDLINQGNFGLVNHVDGTFGKDGWASNFIKNKEADYNSQIDTANERMISNYNRAAENLNENKKLSLLANYTAYGGPLTMRYSGIMSPFGNQFALGGNINNTHGGYFSNGLMQINNGGSHEENPYEGVPMGSDPEGTPNLVEEGETIFNNYVFSDRLKVPKAVRNKYKLRGNKNMTFAEASKIMSKESEERPHDPISQRGLGALLAGLTQAQEMLKMQQEIAKRQSLQDTNQMNLFATGGDTKEDTPEVSPFNDDGTYNANYAPWRENDNYTADYLTALNRLTEKQLVDYFSKLNAWYKDTNNKYTGKYKAVSNLYNKYPALNSATPSIDAALATKLKAAASDGKSGNTHTFLYEAAYPTTVTTAGDPKSAKEVKLPRLDIGVTPEGEQVVLNDFFEGYNDQGKRWLDLNPDWRLRPGQKSGTKAKRNIDGEEKEYEIFFHELKDPGPSEEQIKKAAEAKEAASKIAYMRYLPAAGSAISAISDLAGWTNRADYSSADAIFNNASNMSYTPVGVDYLSNFMSYNPYDINYTLNKLNAQSAATRRAIMNQSAGNRATATANLLANAYNHQKIVGDTLRQAEESNFSRKNEVEKFNTAIHQSNADMALKAAMANQAAKQNVDKIKLTGIAQAMGLRDTINTRRDASISKNVSGFFNSLGSIGQEEYTRNMVMSNPALSYYMDRFGNVQYKQPMANGGYLTIKNKNKYGRY